MTYLRKLKNRTVDLTIKTDKDKKIFNIPDLLTKVEVYYDDITILNMTENYLIKGTETPEIIAYKLYGDMDLHWTILYINKITDLGEQWPIPDNILRKIVKNPDDIHHYEYNGLTVDPSWEPRAVPLTNLDVAIRNNDNRRVIKVIKKEYIGEFVSAFEDALS